MDGGWENPFATGGLNGPVYAMQVYAGQLVAAGAFGSAGGKPASNIARWDGAHWWPLENGISNLSPDDGFTPYVSGLGVHDGGLIVVGAFTRAGDAPTSNVARWDGGAWHPLGGTFDGIVYTADSYGGDLVVGGRFTRIDGVSRRYFARWNGTEWRSANLGPNELVSATVHWDSRLVAAGAFTRADNAPASGVAVWNGAWWEPLGAGMSGGDPRTWVFALTVFRGDLIAGGVFTHADGQLVNGVARWDGQSWRPLGAGILSREDVFVFALASYDDRLFAGGAFTHAGGERVNYIAAWDGSSWSELGGGTDGWVRSLRVLDSSLYVGGHFASAGGQPAQRIARWRSTAVPVRLVEFTAQRAQAGRARVRLQTSSAAAATGFHVHRAAPWTAGSPATAVWTRITGDWIEVAPAASVTVDDPSAPAAPAAYWLEERRAEGTIWHGPALLLPAESDAPPAFALGPVGPNPFGEAAQIQFVIPRSAQVELSVLDLRGRTVARLCDAALDPGAHAFPWDGRDATGAAAAQGVYVVRLRAEHHQSVQRITLLRR